MNRMEEEANASRLKLAKFTYRNKCSGKEKHRNCSYGLHRGAVTLAFEGQQM
jgi:hypothetical protein